MDCKICHQVVMTKTVSVFWVVLIWQPFQGASECLKCKYNIIILYAIYRHNPEVVTFIIFSTYLYNLRAKPFKCWAARPGLLRPARIFVTWTGIPNIALNETEIRRICPPCNIRTSQPYSHHTIEKLINTLKHFVYF